MIEWKDWRLTWDGAPTAMQLDNGSVWLDIVGDVPEGYDWELLLQEPGGGLDALPLQARPGGVGVLLKRENLPSGGTYTLQVRGTLRADGVTQRHSTVTEVLVPASLSEGAAWPELPTAFRELETRMRQLAAHPPQPGANGYWLLWDGDSGAYQASQLPVGTGGPKGDTGAAGPKGDKGDRGEKGDTGAQGPAGEKGAAGDTGAKGDKGDKGEKGDKGDQGETGAAGPTYIPGANISITGTTIDTRAFPCSPNLLDNWYFPHPVNQRGQTVYTGAGYCIDRWKLTNASAKLTVGSGGVTLGTTGGNVWMQSYLEDGDQLLGKTVTVSLLADGALYTASGMLPVEAVTSNTGFMTSGNVGVGLYKTADGRVFAQIGNKSGADAPLTAVKLELGSVQTLAHQDADGAWGLNEIPDYAEQELRCMRYLLRQKTTGKEMFAAMVGSTGRMYFSVPLPVPMRTAPAVTVLAAADLFVAAGRAKLADGVTYDVYDTQANAVTMRTSKNAVLDYTSGEVIAGTVGVFEAALELNAEL